MLRFVNDEGRKRRAKRSNGVGSNLHRCCIVPSGLRILGMSSPMDWSCSTYCSMSVSMSGWKLMSLLMTRWYLALEVMLLRRAILCAEPYPRLLLLKIYVAGRNINASVCISLLSMSHISLTFGFWRSVSTKVFTSAKGVW